MAASSLGKICRGCKEYMHPKDKHPFCLMCLTPTHVSKEGIHQKKKIKKNKKILLHKYCISGYCVCLIILCMSFDSAILGFVKFILYFGVTYKHLYIYLSVCYAKYAFGRWRSQAIVHWTCTVYRTWKKNYLQTWSQRLGDLRLQSVHVHVNW